MVAGSDANVVFRGRGLPAGFKVRATRLLGDLEWASSGLDISIAPFHRAGTNPTLALQRDLEFVEHLDALGFDEAWIGEHHSAGSELIASPEIFIAAAAERTKWIKLCTGVISLCVPQPAVGRRPADDVGPPHPRSASSAGLTGLAAPPTRR